MSNFGVRVDQKIRQARLRLLVRSLNRQRKNQAQKIDILCNHLIEAQREFIKRLEQISTTSMFYRSLLGITEIEALLQRAGAFFEQWIPGARVCCRVDTFESTRDHVLTAGADTESAETSLENCFDSQWIRRLGTQSCPRTLAECIAMGLQVPETLQNESAWVFPLVDLHAGIGILLIYGCGSDQLDEKTKQQIDLIMSGLSQAIGSCIETSGSAS